MKDRYDMVSRLNLNACLSFMGTRPDFLKEGLLNGIVMNDLSYITIQSDFAPIYFLPSDSAIDENVALSKFSTEVRQKALTMTHPLRRSEFVKSRWLFRRVSKLDSDPVLSDYGDLIWPKGFKGSFSHKSGQVALALKESDSDQVFSLGVDLERASVNENIREKVVTDAEWSLILKAFSEFPPQKILAAIFSAKESIFKALYPLVKRKFWFDAAVYVGCDNIKSYSGFNGDAHQPGAISKKLSNSSSVVVSENVINLNFLIADSLGLGMKMPLTVQYRDMTVGGETFVLTVTKYFPGE
ncbi:MAG: 4'-phosphopantetheinyl transferase superfamily protein [Proteobacteria bacterium]|nr:4'-phosphopantetheinyl transferase superfamily protein [Pseudomonadota bacterium]